MPPQLVKTEISGKTLQCAIHLAEGVEKGDVIGAIIGIIYKRQRYSVDVCGEAKYNPTFARGVCHVIDDELQLLIHDQGLLNTTL